MLRLPADLDAEPLMKRFQDLLEGVEFPLEDDAAVDNGRQIRCELFNELSGGERRKG